MEPRNFFFILCALVILLGLTIMHEGSRTYVNNLYQYNVYNVAAAKETGLYEQSFATPRNFRSALKPEAICMAPEDPDPEFEQRFRDKCGYWMKRVDEWKMMMAERQQFVKFRQHQERSGTGDRLAGSMTGFHESSRNGKQLDIRWSNIDKVFKPSCVLNNQFDPERRPLVILNGTRKRLASGSCRGQTWYQCKVTRHNQDKCPIYNRACLGQSYCGELVDTYGKELNMGHVMGCPLRMTYQPKRDFFDHEVMWDIDNKTVNGTIIELITTLKQYETIAIHLRLGDALMTSKVKGLPQSGKENAVVQTSQQCARMVDSHLSKEIKVSKISSKPIKWIIASDDQRIRNYYRENFPEKVIILKNRPRHVQMVKKISKRDGEDEGTNEIRNLFAEWYIIGRADHLIANKAHSFGMSAFSRSAWIYNLKSQYYEVNPNNPKINCRKKEFYYHGNSVTINQVCKNPSNLLTIEQPHTEMSTTS